MKRKVGSTSSLTTVSVESVALGDRRPVVHPRAAQGIDAHLHTRAADRVHVDDVAEVGHVGLR